MDILTLIQTRCEHMRNQGLSHDVLETKKMKKFRRLVAYAKQHSSYYSKIIKENCIDPNICIPEDFPVLTKKDVMGNFDQIVTDKRITKDRIVHFLETSKNPLDLFAGDFYVIHTSGSSGEKGLFVYSQKDWARGMAQALRLGNLTFKKKRIAFIGSTKGHFAGISFVTTGQQPIMKWFYRIETYEINAPIDSFIDRLNDFQPDMLVGYATALAELAKKKLKEPLKSIHR